MRSVDRIVAIWKDGFRKRLRRRVSWGGSERQARLRLRRRLEDLGAFDSVWYLGFYQDVADHGLDPFEHYMKSGWREQRKPTPWFSLSYFRTLRPDYTDTESPLSLVAGMDDEDAAGLLCVLQSGHGRTLDRNRVLLNDGVCLTGYFRSEIGLGQAARNLAYASEAASIPATFLDIHLPGRASDATFSDRCGIRMDRFVQILVLPAFWLSRHEERLSSAGVNILYPFWELGRLPDQCLSSIEKFDEIWAPSRFVQEAFRAATGRPVALLPQPVRIPADVAMSGATDRPFTVLTYLDFDSFRARKNPEAVVAAFQLAFPPSRQDVRLVIKVRGGGNEDGREWLAGIAAADRRVVPIDKTFDRAAMDRLIFDCDVFVSLHRSEGFGFGPAEAMAAGKPVVATDYSGSTDFVTASTGYPVAYDLVPVAEGHYVDWQDQVWAEPRIDDAARLLRAIEADRDAAHAKALRGRQLMIDRFSPQAVGTTMRQMLQARGLLAEMNVPIN